MSERLSIVDHTEGRDPLDAWDVVIVDDPGTAWGSIMEKALAGVDQTWTDERAQDSKVPGHGTSGYDRLDHGTNPWGRAELMTQLTGEEAIVLAFDATPGNEPAAEAALKSRLP